jgi:hypothetical protein
MRILVVFITTMEQACPITGKTRQMQNRAFRGEERIAWKKSLLLGEAQVTRG